MLDQLETEVSMVERHCRVLRAVIGNEPIGIVKLSRTTDLPRHKVRYSLGVLEDTGVVEPTTEGARTTDRTDEFVAEVSTRLAEIGEALAGVEVEGDSE